MPDQLSALAPKYRRVAAELRQQIEDGSYLPGDRLPSETFLSDRHHVSVSTLRQALALLRAEGLVESHHGLGTFVREEHRIQRRSRRLYRRKNKNKKARRLLYSPTFAGRGPLPRRLAAVVRNATEAGAGQEVVIRRRVLTDPGTGRVEEIGASYLPLEIAGGTFLEQQTVLPMALFLCVEELTGKRYSHAQDHWIARRPSADESAALGLPPGAPILQVVHVARADDGTLLEIFESIWPADGVTLIDDYDIVPEPG
jgi:GntR family transcriptional regulator